MPDEVPLLGCEVRHEAELLQQQGGVHAEPQGICTGQACMVGEMVGGGLGLGVWGVHA